ncbi:hypothetical protein [Kocuria sp. UBA1838]|uniref:hypothetical protein n=1 Tax=Kocuria sp. UBA1838 TaxID=1946673 RepID=UPI00257A95B2|nr:hypothetical protein [Kocuria sp. UBA1838]
MMLLTETQATPSEPSLNPWLALIPLGSVLLGGLLAGGFTLLNNRTSNRDNQRSRYEEWTWDNCYQVLGEIDSLHRRLCQNRVRIFESVLKKGPFNRTSEADYYNLSASLANAISRFVILTNEKQMLDQVEKVRTSTRAAGKSLQKFPKAETLSRKEYRAAFWRDEELANKERDSHIRLVQGNLLSVAPKNPKR